MCGYSLIDIEIIDRSHCTFRKNPDLRRNLPFDDLDALIRLLALIHDIFVTLFYKIKSCSLKLLSRSLSSIYFNLLVIDSCRVWLMVDHCILSSLLRWLLKFMILLRLDLLSEVSSLFSGTLIPGSGAYHTWALMHPVAIIIGRISTLHQSF